MLLALALLASAPARADDGAEQRERAVQLLTRMREEGVPRDRQAEWMAVAASWAPEDVGLVEAALADPALLALGPDEARASIAARKKPTSAPSDDPDVAAGVLPPRPRPPVRTPMLGGLETATSPQTIQVVLKGGLRVVVTGDPALTVSTVVTTVHAGSAVEGEQTAGLAHLVEHLMFEGLVDGSTWMDRAEDLGAFANAWTDYDSTRFLTSVAPDALAEALALEGRRFAEPLSTERLAAERLVVQDEVRLRDGLEPGLELRDIGRHQIGIQTDCEPIRHEDLTGGPAG